MTERLSALLHDEASLLDVPPPASDLVLHRGRRLRRRRRLVTAAGAAALALVVGGGAALGAAGLAGDDRTAPDRGVDPATAAYLAHGAFATGSTVHLGDGSAARLDEQVKVLYYTSAGLLARTGEVPWTDDPGPSHYTLVRPDGSTHTLDLDLGDRVPATDPDQPVLTYAEARGGSTDAWDVVVLDVRSGEELARVAVDGSFTWAGWEAPPVELDGDLVFVGLDDATVAVDWRERTLRTTALGGSRAIEVSGGHVVVEGDGSVSVVEVATGEEAWSTSEGRPYVTLSPDGHWAKVAPGGGAGGAAPQVVDLSTGEVHDVDARTASSLTGWTPDGNLLTVDLEARTMTSCTADGDCVDTPVSGPTDGELKLAGVSYES